MQLFRYQLYYPYIYEYDYLYSFCNFLANFDTNLLQNEGENRPTSEAFRLSREAYPLQYVNDGKDGTAWISTLTPVIQIVIDLLDVFEVRSSFH